MKKKPLFFRIILFALRLFYPKTNIVGWENVPNEPCVIIGNHTQMHGPITCELFLPDNCYTWCEAKMMELKDVPAYAFADFWSQKPKYTHPFYKLLSYMIAPISAVIFSNARTIPVFRDSRILTTFKKSLEKLQDGKNIVIFPEYDKKYNNILYDFRKGFIDIAKLYYKRTGKELSFVPLYIAPKLKEMHFGKLVKFSAEAPLEEEKKRIRQYLMDELTEMAINLPPHTVIPYRNIPKKFYPQNTPKETS